MKVYVLLAFFFVFFLFCWRRGAPNNQLEEKVAIFVLQIFILITFVVAIFLGSLYFFTIQHFHISDGLNLFCRRGPIITIQHCYIFNFLLQEGTHCLLRSGIAPPVVT